MLPDAEPVAVARTAQAQPAGPARPSSLPPTKRLRTQVPNVVGPTDGEPPIATGSGHQVHTWGKAEWCSLCGRVTAASVAGRAQQWRRPCAPLPSFVSKQQRGHSLVYTGQWQCQACPCPSDKLYRQKCVRGSPPSGPPEGESPSPKPCFLVHTAPGPPAPGNHAPQAAPGKCARRKVPLQASLSCFFGPAVKRLRPSSSEAASLPQATARPPG